MGQGFPPGTQKSSRRVFNFYEELGVFSILLVVNLIGLVMAGQWARVREGVSAGLASAWEALRLMGSNPYLALFLWLMFAQGCGWVGVLLTGGWKAIVQNQTGSP